MSSTCFEHEGSSSGNRMYILLWYGTFYMHHQYTQPSRQTCALETHSSAYQTAYTNAQN